MDAATFISAIHTALAPYVRAAGGRLDIAADPDEVIDMLQAAQPRGWRVVISYAGEQARNPDTAPGILTLSLNTTVQAARGLAIGRDMPAYRRNQAGRDPLLAIASQVSAWIRGLAGEHPDIAGDAFALQSQQWLVIDGLPTRQVNQVHTIDIAQDNPVPVPVAFP